MGSAECAPGGGAAERSVGAAVVSATPASVTPTNKGAEIAVAVDWLSVTLREAPPQAVAAFLEDILPTTWASMRGRFGYERALRGTGGACILFSPGRPDVHVSLPGGWCAAVSRSALRKLIVHFTESAGHWTRCNLAGTDRSRVVEPEDVAAAIERGEHVTHARQLALHRGLAHCVGATVYIGSKSSRQQVLVYDKTAESSGAVAGVRWELRARDEAAASLVQQLLEHDDWGGVWAGRLVSFIDFRQRRAGREPQRCGRTPWFEQLVGPARKIRAYPPAPDRSPERTRQWLRRQVAPTLARLVAANGGDMAPLYDLVAEGQRRQGLASVGAKQPRAVPRMSTEDVRLVEIDSDFSDWPLRCPACGNRGRLEDGGSFYPLTSIRVDGNGMPTAILPPDYENVIVDCTRCDHDGPIANVQGALYVCMSTKEWPTVSRLLAEAGAHWSDTIIWAKDRFVLGRADYQRQYEPLWYGWPEGGTHHWCGDRDQADVWTIPRPAVSDLHPTSKPLALVERAIENSSRPGDTVLDLFLGSGTALIACERTGRTCYAMEIDPRYTDVTIARWRQFTGQEARREPGPAA